MVRCKLCHSTNCLRSYRVRQYQYYHCNNCNSLFLYPFPKVQSIELLYKEFPYKTGLIEEERIRQQSKKILAKLHLLNQKGKSLLDIGSGYGFFLDEANKTGLITTGIEPSKKLYVSINQLIDTRTINSSFNRFYRLNKSKKYDFITLIHVIEHVLDPVKTIKQALLLLNPNGILYVETPNLKSHLFNAEKEHYAFLTPPEHLWIFSRKSFNHILNSYKLLTTTYSYPEHLMGILKRNFQFPISNFQINSNNQNSNFQKVSNLKFRLIDRFIAPILTPFLNLGGYGSILELYIKKI